MYSGKRVEHKAEVKDRHAYKREVTHEQVHNPSVTIKTEHSAATKQLLTTTDIQIPSPNNRTQPAAIPDHIPRHIPIQVLNLPI